MALTEKRIRDAKPGPKPTTIWDSQVVGLGVRVFPTGRKSYVLSYRAGGKKRLATLARCSETSLREARERAGREMAAIRDGEADPLTRREEQRAAPTVAEGIERFFAEYAPRRVELGRMSPRTVREYLHQANRYILPAFGGVKVEDVTRRHVEKMVDRLPNATRNRVLALTSRLFTLFARWEWRAQNRNPAQGIERAREDARDRTLAPSELAALSAALNGLDDKFPASVAAIRLAAVTGLRIGEVLAVRWEHVDFEGGRLSMPKTKTGRRVHDLPAAALQILSALPRLNAWAFSTGSDAAVTYRTARKHFAGAAKDAGLQDVRLHDLRRTVMTNAAAAGVGTHVLRDLLGHRTAAMADRYIRAVGNPVRDAREQVGAAMAAMMDGGKSEVVPMRRPDANRRG